MRDDLNLPYMRTSILQTEQEESRKKWMDEAREGHIDVIALAEQTDLVKQVRLEAIGYRVGYALVEKISKDLP
uniref:Uncharacterized protein n=1 Tax=Parascaris equorum TaxID=6256 RepID=A0A914S0A5_PAREQ